MKKEVSSSTTDLEKAHSSIDGDSSEQQPQTIRPQIGRKARGPNQRQQREFAVPSNKGAQDHVRGTHGHKSWRLLALRFIHHHWFQRIMCCLLLVDVLVLFTELTVLVGAVSSMRPGRT